MIESIRTIEKEPFQSGYPTQLEMVPLLHAIHTTADFDMENIIKVDEDAVERIYKRLTEGE